MNFIGRKEELASLSQVASLQSASLVVVRGRRRIGKSRLIAEFAQRSGRPFYKFVGLAPGYGITAEVQRNEFMRQFSEQFDMPKIQLDDWGDIFTLLAKIIQQQQVIVLFDEISWMAQQDATFLAKLKTSWDEQLSKNPKLMLILCGSISTWIEKNIISSTGYLGRPTRILDLEPLPLVMCNEFWGAQKTHLSAFEKLKMLSVTGGVPRYLELININLSAQANIQQLCFDRSSPLIKEFQHVFADIFGSRSELYRHIVTALLDGSKTQEELTQSLGRQKSGDLSNYLEDLRLAGFIARDFTWHLKSGNQSKLSCFRLKDNFIRFYLKYMQPNQIKIEQGLFHGTSIRMLPGWESILGLQFENLILNNMRQVVKLLSIGPGEIVFANPYFQRHTQKQHGCQIDLLIQLQHNTVYVCEIKFLKEYIGYAIIDEVKQKIQRLSLPKHFSYRPVLIHVNGVADSVRDSGYFSHIIDFEDLLGHQ